MITRYYPTEHTSLKDGILIVKRDEDMALYGVIDTNGAVVIDPQYDELRITEVNGNNYLVADLEGKYGVLEIDGTEKIAFEYDEIKSGGDIGWMAEKDGVQYILNEDGSINKQLDGRYGYIVDNKYLCPGTMRDAYMIVDRELYDLNENLIEGELPYDVKMLGYDDLFVASSSFFSDSNQMGYACLQIRKIKGDIIANIATVQDGVYNIDEDKHEFLVKIAYGDKIRTSSETYKNAAAEAGLLGSALEDDKYYIFNTDTKEFTPYPTPYYPNGFAVEENGEFSRVYYGQDGIDLFGEKFKTVIERSNGFLLENVDGQYAWASITGKMLVPFGETDSMGSYNGNKYVRNIEDNEYFGLISQKSDGSYVFPVF